jgi:alanyl-tRNA synthetase
METAEIRRRWLRFFEERDHVVVPSASLLLDDPNLLFVNAGMVPFKPYFLGQQQPPWKRATSVQKCVRTQDIEEVGKTSRHGTFFQMNGNFSFGDYFKAGAITYAWDLVTSPQSEGGFGLPEDKLWVTAYFDDDEAVALWKKIAGVPDERIVRRGKSDNYWSMGVPGPGGPCSEIYIDRGAEYGPDGGPDVDEDRYLEFWNLVFMQEELSAVRSKEDFDIKGPLPAQNIDTGMGLERVASILQGVDNLYEIDEVRPVLDKAVELSGKTYGREHQDDIRLRVVADHVRTSLMLASDGVTPGNEGRGYVLRRLIRRVVRSMRLLGVDDPVMPVLLPVSLERMKASYPELEASWERISTLAYAEEESFRHTLKAGEQHFLTATSQLSGPDTSLSGDEAFRLHDTYGFPIELTLEMAEEAGLAVDEDGFRRLMSEQRQRAKADAYAKKTGHVDVSAYRAVADRAGPTTFIGYEATTSDARVAGLVVDGEPAESAQEGQDVELVLDRTPFYAEGGGQLGDTGRIELDNGTVLEVLDVQAPVPGLSVHRVRIVDGEIVVGAHAQAVVDLERRLAISRAHTATHMIHKAFREELGETATQMGSENSPGRLRFDFPNPTAVPPSVVGDVEARVNEVLLEDLVVSAELMSQEEARAIGAMALFGEKYGDRVRVVSVGDWARELCGGTHTHRTGQLGVVKIVGESSVGAGVRRIEALVGADAYRYLAREHLLVSRLSEALKARPEELPERVEAIVGRLREAERELERLRRAHLLADSASLVGVARDVAGIQVQSFAAPEGTDAGALRDIVIDARGRVPSGAPAVVVGLAPSDGKVSAVVAATAQAIEAGVSARGVLQTLLTHVDGRGGGKDDVAQGGGTSPEGIAAALAAVDEAVRASTSG